MTKHHKLDTDQQVFFYEQEFYVLSNFSAFAIWYDGALFPTAEHLYHYLKFRGLRNQEGRQFAIRSRILGATSAHAAFQLAQENRHLRDPFWDDIKVEVMWDILRAKSQQHEYVHRKLMETGDRELVEDSWRDDFWGWGPRRDGQNMLGRLWMARRAELRGRP